MKLTMSIWWWNGRRRWIRAKRLWRPACAPRAAARPADAGAARLGTTTAQLLAMVGWLRLWRVQRVVMESAKQDGIPATKSAVTPDLLEDA